MSRTTSKQIIPKAKWQKPITDLSKKSPTAFVQLSLSLTEAISCVPQVPILRSLNGIAFKSGESEHLEANSLSNSWQIARGHRMDISSFVSAEKTGTRWTRFRANTRAKSHTLKSSCLCPNDCSFNFVFQRKLNDTKLDTVYHD